MKILRKKQKSVYMPHFYWKKRKKETGFISFISHQSRIKFNFKISPRIYIFNFFCISNHILLFLFLVLQSSAYADLKGTPEGYAAALAAQQAACYPYDPATYQYYGDR